MTSEYDVASDNKRMDEVLAQEPNVALGWFRDAFHTHKSQIDYVLKQMDELRQLFLRAKQGPLTVQEARLCKVCRICRNKEREGPGLPFRYAYGEEYAHVACLEQVKAVEELREWVRREMEQEPDRPRGLRAWDNCGVLR